jgi:DNA-binding CsgD family transcriptional regulator
MAGLLEGTSEAALAITQSGEICCSNSSAELLFHRPRKGMNHSACWNLLSARSENGELICHPQCQVLARALAGESTSNFDCELTLGGTHCWVNVSTLLVNTADAGRIIVHLVRDVDTRKRLECVTRRFLDQLAALSGETVERLMASPPPHLELSSRELQVLRCLSECRSTPEIAMHLGVSIATVRNHLNHVLQKLGAHSRMEAVIKALHDRLI